MNIQLKSITLLNFKGIRNLSINLNEGGATSIYGKNAIGKTTIFDAFTWLLFGKDSTDKKDFNIKTLDGSGNVIEKLPHEVSAIIIVDGEEMNLRKRYDEVWRKKSGSAIEDFRGNEVHPFINDVPFSVTEYQKKVSEICDENIFKLITNPLYMPSMKKDAQRQTLFSMAGELRDEDIAAGNKRFIALLNSLTGKTIEEYKRQITAAKNRIKGELQEIPGRIDECKRSMPVVESWIALEKDLKEKQEDIRNVEAMLDDLSTSYEKESKVRVEVVKEISQKKVQREQIKSTIENEIMADYRDKKNKRQSLILKLNQCRNNEKAGNASIEEVKSGIEDLKAKRDELVAAWYSINGEQITFDDNQFVCPTCKRGLDSEDIETLKAEMSETFNANKAARLLENQKQGMSIKARIEASNRTLKTYEQRLEEIQNEIGEIIFDNLYQTEPVEPETASKVSSDQRYITISAEITELEKKIEGEIKQPENAELKTQRNELQEACRAIERRLINKTTIDNIDKRIAELDTQYKVLSQELAENEGVEFTIDAFSKAKVETVEKRINSMFAVVRWKMFEKQINGGEVPTCEAMVNGVPFSDVNKADQINAGIDIINAICHHRNVFAPIFVDNAESVNSLLQTNSQIIRLVVTLDNQITVQ